MFLKIINKLIYTAIHIVNYKNIISYFIVIYDYFMYKHRVVNFFSTGKKISMYKEGGQSLVISLFQPKFLVGAEKNCQDICHLIS